VLVTLTSIGYKSYFKQKIKFAYVVLCCRHEIKLTTVACFFEEFLSNLKTAYQLKITQKSIEVDAETKESPRKTEEKLDGRYKEGRERKKPK